MSSKIYSIILLLILPLWVQAATKTVPNSSQAVFKVVLVTPDMIKQAQQGGLVIYMRHGKTNTRIPDQVPIDLADCTTQRPLTEAGMAEAKQIGEWFAQLDLPYDEVLVSPLCRAKQTAILTFAKPITVDENLQYPAGLSTKEKQPIIIRTRELLSTPVPLGENRVIVAHGPNLVEMMDYFPPEGTLVFIRPLGDKGFEYMGSIPPVYWPDLLKQLSQ